MQSTHTKIAFSIGRIVEERLKEIRREPLPDGLIDLLGRFSEADDARNSTSKKASPSEVRKSHLRRHL
jgi:hypothetical protein